MTVTDLTNKYNRRQIQFLENKLTDIECNDVSNQPTGKQQLLLTLAWSNQSPDINAGHVQLNMVQNNTRLCINLKEMFACYNTFISYNLL